MTTSVSASLPRLLAAWQFFVPQHPLLMPECINVLDAYNDPKRPYHNLTHLSDVLEKLDWARGIVPTPDMDDDTRARMFMHIELALFYHDVIYDATAKDSEAQSRDLFLQHAVSFGMDDADKTAIARLIDITATHTQAATLDEHILCDCDLAILGAEPESFARYDRNIRIEYAHVPADIWNQRRPAVLQHFLDQPRLYKTDAFHARFDAQARDNLRSALAPSPIARITRLFKR